MPPLIFDKKIDFLTEGYIQQLVLNSGFKHVGSIVPHTFKASWSKSAGALLIASTTYNNSDAIFFGTVNLSIYSTDPELLETYLKIGTASQIYLPRTVGLHRVENILFDTVHNASNPASVSAAAYEQCLHFTGYKIAKL